MREAILDGHDALLRLHCDLGASGAAGAWFRCSSAFLRVSSKPPEAGGATGAAPPAGCDCDAGAGPMIEVGARLKLASQDNSRLVAKKQTARMAVVRVKRLAVPRLELKAAPPPMPRPPPSG